MTLILSGTDGLSDVDGSAATPAIRGTDTNTGIFFPAADQVAITTGGTQRAVVDASGNVGIGVTSPQSTLQVGNVTSGTSESTNKGLVMIQSSPATVDSAGGLEFKTSASGSGYGWKIGGLNTTNDPFVIGNRSNSAAFTERARIDSAGNMGLGVTPSAWASRTVLEVGAAGNAFVSGGAGDVYVTEGCYYNAGWKYGNSLYATALYNQYRGTHSWSTAASGTAGNTISFTTAMTLDASSNLSVAGTITSGKGADVASTGSMTLGTGNFFDITGTTTISNIAIKPAGTVVYLKFAGTVNLQTGTIGNSGAMRLTGGATLVVTQYDVLTLISDGTNWWQVAVNNN